METRESQQKAESCSVNLSSQKPNKVTAGILHRCLLSQPVCGFTNQDLKEEKYFLLMRSVESGWSSRLKAYKDSIIAEFTVGEHRENSFCLQPGALGFLQLKDDFGKRVYLA